MNFFARRPIAQETARVLLNSAGPKARIWLLQIVEIFYKVRPKFLY
jgi:hypothetical protein